MVFLVTADDQAFAQQRSASSMITDVDINTFSCRCRPTNCNSLAVRPFMAIEFFSGVLKIPESIWSDIQDRSTNIALYISSNCFWLAFRLVLPIDIITLDIACSK